ncbi:MAG: methionyl-tRNA formyltransferase [Candidatus Omnitrophica bacterium]|nr:methionyl-tRNA formyltransferase [Candidatus Omnitrophota bacterium]
MRIVFFGTGKFGIPSLERLIQSNHEVIAVISQPDRKKGRGMKIQPTPVKEFVWTMRPEIEVIQPEKASEKGFIAHLATMKADLFVAIDYGQILSGELLEVPARYCVNLHPSLLPRYRGPAPVAWAILNGERTTGNTVIRMNERMDAGDILLQKKMPLKGTETRGELLKRLSYEGAELVLKAVELIDSDAENLVEQNEKAATYAPKLSREVARIDWKDSAEDIERKVRAMQPRPGAFARIDRKTLKIIEAGVVETARTKGKPGTVETTNGFIVNTGKGKLYVKKLQLEGKRPMTSEEFLRGFRVEGGTALK